MLPKKYAPKLAITTDPPPSHLNTLIYIFHQIAIYILFLSAEIGILGLVAGWMHPMSLSLDPNIEDAIALGSAIYLQLLLQ